MMAPQDEIEATIQRVGDDAIGHDPEDITYLSEPGHIVLKNPEPPFRLGRFSVICIICNRMIGTGIFLTPTKVVRYTHSVGITLLFWLCGAIAAMAGILVYMEFGLTTPRYTFTSWTTPRNLLMAGAEGKDESEDDGEDQKVSVPRNGGELHYLKDIVRRPLFLSTCIFGIAFILLGNVAPNSISFGIRVLEARGRPVDNFEVRGIAIAVVTFACLFHGIWRLGGIYLSNILAVVKISILFVIFVTGIVSLFGVFKRPAAAAGNFNIHTAFKDPQQDPSGFAESFLAIIFAFGGFNQANYVMSEIDNPRKKYKWSAFAAVAGVCTLYMLVNVAYFLVVPVEVQLSGVDVAQTFFNYTFGTISTRGTVIAPRVLAGFMAVSSLGNIIVMTYTAARVKQEIAKEGILPFRKFISRSFSIPIGELFCRPSITTDDETPIGALILHWALSVLLILATGAQSSPDASYRVLVSLYSYTVDAFFGLCLGAGLLFLRCASRRKWAKKSKAGSGITPVVSIVAGLLFTIANAFPIIAAWIPPSNGFLGPGGADVPWYTTPTVGWTVIVLGSVYWLGFRFIVPYVGENRGRYLKVDRKLYFHEEHGYPVQVQENLNFEWVKAGSNTAWAVEDKEIDMPDRLTPRV